MAWKSSRLSISFDHDCCNMTCSDPPLVHSSTIIIHVCTLTLVTTTNEWSIFPVIYKVEMTSSGHLYFNRGDKIHVHVCIHVDWSTADWLPMTPPPSKKNWTPPHLLPLHCFPTNHHLAYLEPLQLNKLLSCRQQKKSYLLLLFF